MRIRHGADTAATLTERRPLAPERVAWLSHGGARVPLPFPLGAGELRPEPGAILGADLVASVFWWLAGVQEIATPRRDPHGRFPYAASLQAALGTPLATPVDAMREVLAEALTAAGVELHRRDWDGHRWAVAFTFDLDALATPRLRVTAGALRKRQWRRAWRTLSGGDRRRDTAHRLVDLAAELGGGTAFVKGGASSRHDVPYALGPHAAWLRESERRGVGVGVHPSYHAHDDPARLGRERDAVAEALGRASLAVRSHYLRWSIPQTPRAYAGAGFRLDSTLGFAEHEGFRRGTARPFRLFDLDADAPTALVEAPPAVMDQTLLGYRGLSLDGQREALADVLGAAERAAGCAVVLWHNDMGDSPEWDARLDLLRDAIADARGRGAWIGSLGDAVAHAGHALSAADGAAAAPR